MKISGRELLQRTTRTCAGLGLGWLAGPSGLATAPADTDAPNPGADRPPTSTDASRANALSLPDADIVSAFARAATQNVLAAVDPSVFFGYWSVCADREGFGCGNTYPSLDGHQMTDALLWLGQVEVVKANWDYVRSFQKPNGRLPLAILPGATAVYGQPVEPNG